MQKRAFVVTGVILKGVHLVNICKKADKRNVFVRALDEINSDVFACLKSFRQSFLCLPTNYSSDAL